MAVTQVEYQPQASRKRLAADNVGDKGNQSASFAPWLVLVVLLVVGGVVWGQVAGNTDHQDRGAAATDSDEPEAAEDADDERVHQPKFTDHDTLRDYRFRDNPFELSQRVTLQGINYSPRSHHLSRARINHNMVRVGDMVLDGEFVVDTIQPFVVILRDRRDNYHRLVWRVDQAAERYNWNPDEIRPYREPPPESRDDAPGELHW